MAVEPFYLSDIGSTWQNAADVAGKATMGKDDFLKLLVAQMRNQDPLSPMEGAEYAAQLAQFSSLEQLIEISRQMGVQTTATQEANSLGMTSYATSMIGREIVLEGALATIGEDGTASIVVDLPEGVHQLTITLENGAGEPIGTAVVPAPAAGRQSFILPFEGVGEGDYRYTATAVNSSGENLVTRPLTVGRVDGMSMVGGEIMLRLGGTLVPFSDIVEVRSATQPTVPAPASTNNGGSES